MTCRVPHRIAQVVLRRALRGGGRPTRHGPAPAAVALVALVAAAGCGGDQGAAQTELTSPVSGLITSLEGTTMELEVGGRLAGQRVELEVADPYVTVDHLEEHLEQRLPVRVQFERRGDRLFATVIEDEHA